MESALLTALLDDTSDLVCATGPDGLVVYANRTLRETLGYTAEEAEGQPADAFVAPEDRERYRAMARQLVAGTPVRDFEAMLVAKDGRRVACRGRATPEMRDTPAGPRCVGVRSVYRDVSSVRAVVPHRPGTGEVRAVVPDAAGASGARAQGHAVADDLVLLLRVEGPGAFRCESANAAYLAATGRCEDEVVGRRLEDVVAEPARAATLARFDAALATGAALRYDETLALRAGSVVLETTLVPILGPGARCTHLLSASRDVTEGRRWRTAVAESERRYRALFEEAGDAMLVCDGTDAAIVDANARYLALVGLPRSAVVGRPLADFLGPDRAAPDVPPGAALHAAGVAEEPHVSERTLRRGDGTEVPVEVTATLLDGERIQCICRDVTERQRVEQLKERLVGVASHELRTPLSAVLGALQLLTRMLPPLDPQPQRLFDMAQRNTERLLRLVTDLLDVEALEAGAAPLDRQPHAATALLEQARDAAELAARAAGVTLVVEAAPLLVWADRERTIQVATNLVANAIKFSPPGGTVTLVAEAGMGEARFGVRDRGRGIPPEQLERVFERFAQVEPSDRRVKRGAGLGLAICRAIVLQHGGRIWAESPGPHQGSTFWFTIPQRPEERGSV